MTEEELNEMAEKYALSKWEGQVPWGLIAQGYKDGYLEGLKAKINATTISDCPIKDEQGDKEEQLEYAKTIIQDLLDNSDEYARQRAVDFLEEEK